MRQRRVGSDAAPPKKPSWTFACVWYNRRSGTWTETDIGSVRWFLHDACKGCHLPHSHSTDRGTTSCSTGRAQLPVALTPSPSIEEKNEERGTNANGRWILKKGVEQVLKWRHHWNKKLEDRNEQHSTVSGRRRNNSGSGKRTKYHSKQKHKTNCISSYRTYWKLYLMVAKYNVLQIVENEKALWKNVNGNLFSINHLRLWWF